MPQKNVKTTITASRTHGRKTRSKTTRAMVADAGNFNLVNSDALRARRTSLNLLETVAPNLGSNDQPAGRSRPLVRSRVRVAAACFSCDVSDHLPRQNQRQLSR
jgi:hypothetical protein